MSLTHEVGAQPLSMSSGGHPIKTSAAIPWQAPFDSHGRLAPMSSLRSATPVRSPALSPPHTPSVTPTKET